MFNLGTSFYQRPIFRTYLNAHLMFSALKLMCDWLLVIVMGCDVDVAGTATEGTLPGGLARQFTRLVGGRIIKGLLSVGYS